MKKDNKSDDLKDFNNNPLIKFSGIAANVLLAILTYALWRYGLDMWQLMVSLILAIAYGTFCRIHAIKIAFYMADKASVDTSGQK